MLEDASRYQRSLEVREEPQQPPRFVRELRDVLNVNEHGFAHFEAQVEPVSDSHMRIDWFKDGQAITASKYTPAGWVLWQTGCMPFTVDIGDDEPESVSSIILYFT